jgi:hypothetical protein
MTALEHLQAVSQGDIVVAAVCHQVNSFVVTIPLPDRAAVWAQTLLVDGQRIVSVLQPVLDGPVLRYEPYARTLLEMVVSKGRQHIATAEGIIALLPPSAACPVLP